MAEASLRAEAGLRLRSGYEESDAYKTLSAQPARPARHRWDQRGERGA